MPGHGAGEFNTPAIIQRNDAELNPSGQLRADWETVGVVEWTQLIPKGANETRLFDQVVAHATHIVRTRFASAQMKAVRPANYRFFFPDEGLTLNIDSKINVDSRNIEYQFACSEVQQ